MVTEHTRFGPAGVPPMFRFMGATMADVPKLLHEEGLDAFEYQASRWGPVPQVKREDAERLGAEARKNDVKLSMHGSYFVNLSGKKEVVAVYDLLNADPQDVQQSLQDLFNRSTVRMNSSSSTRSMLTPNSSWK